MMYLQCIHFTVVYCMDAVIRKWGNSPALRLTTAVLKEAGLKLEERVELVVTKGQVIITAIDKVEYDLDTLVSGINDLTHRVGTNKLDTDQHLSSVLQATTAKQVSWSAAH